MPKVVLACTSNLPANLVTKRLLIMSVRLFILFPRVSTVYALLKGFLLFIVKRSLTKLIGRLKLYNRDYLKGKKIFCSLLPRIDPKTSSLAALCITHCSYLSFCLLLIIYHDLSIFMFLNFRFIPRQLYFLFIVILHAFSEFSVAFKCFSGFFLLICRSSYNTFIEHDCSP